MTETEIAELRALYACNSSSEALIIFRLLDALESARNQPCPHVVTSGEGTSHCSLAAEMQADARRYRWLRDGGVAEVYLPSTDNASGWAVLDGFMDKDGAIDRALAAQEKT